MRFPVVIASAVTVFAVAFGAWFLFTPAAPPAARPTPAAAPAVAAPAEPAAVAPAAPAPEPARRAAAKPSSPAPETPAPAPAEAAPTTATLRVETDVTDATVFIDRVGIGPAPITIPNLPPGPHRLNVSAPGYESYGETIELEPGNRTIAVAFKVIRLDVKMAAVHKHGMGSCKGQLLATPEGLRYTAADGKDSLSATLVDLTGFDLDYLAKNLRVKTRDGKTLNFTDPEGNADRLFAFHRDVDKARKRVIAGQ